MNKKGFTPTPISVPFRFSQILSREVSTSVREAICAKDAGETKKQHRNRCGGFTLIELLIVIAIIGILASVVLGSLNTARTKANDAAIKSNLNNLREQASIWYDDNAQVYASAGNVYATSTCPTALSSGNIFSNQKVFDGVSAAYTKAGGYTKSQCVADATTWAVAVQLATSDGAGNVGADSWCVDSTGSSRSYAYGASETIANVINGSDACK